MENLGNFEKIKENLNIELDNIIDDKRALFEQIKNLEKEEYLIKNNIFFFENYLRLFESEGKIDDLDINEFMKSLPIENVGQEKRGKRKPTQDYSGIKKKDLIEENIKAFDEAHNYVYENKPSEPKLIKSKKSKTKEKQKEKEKSPVRYEDEDNISKKNYQDENYFVNIIKRNFES